MSSGVLCNSDSLLINNLASNPEYSDALAAHRKILDEWMDRTDDKGQYPESAEGLAQVYFRWHTTCVNPEYKPVQKKYAEALKEVQAKAADAARAKAARKKKAREENRKKRQAGKQGN